jgi:hypothetical protein
VANTYHVAGGKKLFCRPDPSFWLSGFPGGYIMQCRRCRIHAIPPIFCGNHQAIDAKLQVVGTSAYSEFSAKEEGC